MSIRKVNFVEGGYYHIYNRGNSKQKIFHNKADYERFISLLYLSNSGNNFKIDYIGKHNIYITDRGSGLVSIGAYCLMPNHFHILITPLVEGGVSKFMQKMTTAYSMYYNQKYRRTGGLFEGKFKAEYANNDKYLKYLFSYIHLNPIKLIDSKWKEKGIKNKATALAFLKTYQYSSYASYIETNRVEEILLNKESFPKYFSNPREFQKEIFDWLSYKY